MHTAAAQDQACVRGDACPYAHNVFEYWLHPTRYRTQLCNDGEKCARKICFFAHSLEELRTPATKPFVPPEALAAATTSAALEAVRKAVADGGCGGGSAGQVRSCLHACMHLFLLLSMAILPRPSQLCHCDAVHDQSWLRLWAACTRGQMSGHEAGFLRRALGSRGCF
jgi:hypothetical protein